MRFIRNSFAVLIVVLSTLAVQARTDLSCRATACVIPFDVSGVENGVEICYSDRKKTEKLKEVTWVNGRRNGPVRCFEKGKATIEANFQNDRLHGLYIRRSHGVADEVMLLKDGKRDGFTFGVQKDTGEVSLIACFRNDREDASARRVCEKANYGAYAETIAKAIAAEAKLKGEQEARRNGPQIEKYPDGKIRAQYTTKNGEIIGLERLFYPDGKSQAEIAHDQNGKLDGESKYYTKDGYLAVREIYAAGKISSRVRMYNNGKPIESETWAVKDGVRIRCDAFYHQNSTTKSYEQCWKESGGYYGGVQHGSYRVYSAEGRVVVEGEYNDGVKTGVWRSYNAEDNFALRSEAVFEKGRPIREVWYEGSQKTTREFEPDGSVKSEITSNRNAI